MKEWVSLNVSGIPEECEDRRRLVWGGAGGVCTHTACVLTEVVFLQCDCRCARSTGLSNTTQNTERAPDASHPHQSAWKKPSRERRKQRHSPVPESSRSTGEWELSRRCVCVCVSACLNGSRKCVIHRFILALTFINVLSLMYIWNMSLSLFKHT